MSQDYCVSAQDILDVYERTSKVTHETPVLTSSRLNKLSGKNLFFKCEALQKTGSFKARGALNAVLSLSDEQAAKGVATHSSGNHGQALAYAAQQRGIPATVVMPKNAPAVKVAAVRGYGADVVFCEPTQASREETLEKVIAESGAVFIHPSNEPRVIAGQGGIGIELMKQLPDVTCVVVPIGGGGMVSGISIYIKSLFPHVKIVGVEPADADDAFRSKQEGHICKHAKPPVTVADGVKSILGPNTWPCVRDLVDEIIVVEDKATIAAMKDVWTNLKICIEPTAGLGMAAVYDSRFPKDAGDKIAVILCGGNVDITKLPW